MQTEMSSIACWRFMLACWLTYGYFNVDTNNVNKKMAKKGFFLTACHEPVRPIRQGSGQAMLRIDIIEGGSREI